MEIIYRVIRNYGPTLRFMCKFTFWRDIDNLVANKGNASLDMCVSNLFKRGESTPDMVATSIEIALRAYKKYEKGWFYPKFNIQYRDEQWKQTLGTVENWKELFQKIKESKLKYRFQLLDYIQNAVFSKNYIQKCYFIYTFA